MTTAIIAICHAFGTNKSFQPTILYLGTIMVDVALFDAFARALA